MDSERVPVAWYDDPAEAELARLRLEAEGLPAWVENTGVLGIGWCHPGQPGGLELMTLESDAKEALALLERIEAEYEPEVPEEYSPGVGSEVCPECGSTEIRFEPRHWAEDLVTSANSAFFGRSAGPHWRCRPCGHRWQAKRRAGDDRGS